MEFKFYVFRDKGNSPPKKIFFLLLKFELFRIGFLISYVIYIFPFNFFVQVFVVVGCASLHQSNKDHASGKDGVGSVGD